jgi:protein TonB
VTQKPVFVEGLFTLRNLRSMGAAAILEVLLGAGIAGILIWHQLQPPPAIPLPPVVDPVIDPTPQLPVQHHTVVPEPHIPTTQPFHEVPPVLTDVPGMNTEKVLPPQQPLVPSQGASSAELLAQFSAGMLRAINAQKVYPRISMLKAESGEAVVSFDYVEGMVSNLHVDKSSGSRDLDRAALDAVQRAVLPPKPADLAGMRHFAFTLVFDLGG